MESLQNTPKNKKKFLSQFWGQENILQVDQEGYDANYMTWGEETNYGSKTPNFKLNWIATLRTIDSLTDEEAKEICSILGLGKNSTDNIILLLKQNYHILYYDAYQYLQTIGFALPWRGISVETLIEWGWIKLID